MIRKQFHLKPIQNNSLKRCARELGVSEAEFVRRTLDKALKPTLQPQSVAANSNLKDLFAEADIIAKTHSFGNYCFNRQALAGENKHQ